MPLNIVNAFVNNSFNTLKPIKLLIFNIIDNRDFSVGAMSYNKKQIVLQIFKIKFAKKFDDYKLNSISFNSEWQ